MASTAQPEQPRILVVDDDPSTTAFVADLLGEEGFAVTVCHSGPQAIEAAGREPVDLVVLDVLMPQMDGLAVAQELKKLFGAETFVPIILVSALAAEEHKLAGLACADDYVVKPFSGVELLARIRAFLRIRAVHRDLALTKRLYQSLYDSTPYMSVSLDAGLVVTGCNSAFARAVGLAREAVTGRELASFFAADERFALGRFVGELSREEGTGRETRFSLLPPAAGGEPLVVGLRAVHVPDGGPGLAVVVGMLDITRRMRLEEEQRVARLQLYRSARLTSLGTLASGVAHEMNNPLTAILGFSSALLDRVKRDGGVPPPELSEYLGIINAETLRCRDIVEALSTFAREREARVSDVALAECVATAVRLLLPRAQKHDIAMVVHVPEDLYVRADGGRLGQALVNVLSNCLDFMVKPGTVAIESQARGTRPEMVTLRILDDGPGIPPDALPKVFDPFFSTKEAGKGMGLGLTMCHTILKESGGSIDISSEPGRGTVVVLEIPLAQAGAHGSH